MAFAPPLESEEEGRLAVRLPVPDATWELIPAWRKSGVKHSVAETGGCWLDQAWETPAILDRLVGCSEMLLGGLRLRSGVGGGILLECMGRPRPLLTPNRGRVLRSWPHAKPMYAWISHEFHVVPQLQSQSLADDEAKHLEQRS